MVLHKGSTPDGEQKTHKKEMVKILVAGKRLQSNWENREQQTYFWNIIVLQEKSQSGVRKLPYYRKLTLHEIKVLEINAT